MLDAEEINARLAKTGWNLEVDKVFSMMEDGEFMCYLCSTSKTVECSVERMTKSFKLFSWNDKSDVGGKEFTHCVRLPERFFSIGSPLFSLYKISVIPSLGTANLATRDDYVFTMDSFGPFYFEPDNLALLVPDNRLEYFRNSYGFSGHITRPFIPLQSIEIHNPRLAMNTSADTLENVEVTFHDYRVIMEQNGICCPRVSRG